jgi:hypothetical protein
MRLNGGGASPPSIQPVSAGALKKYDLLNFFISILSVSPCFMICAAERSVKNIVSKESIFFIYKSALITCELQEIFNTF